jgi:hypothetical protein
MSYIRRADERILVVHLSVTRTTHPPLETFSTIWYKNLGGREKRNTDHRKNERRCKEGRKEREREEREGRKGGEEGRWRP